MTRLPLAGWERSMGLTMGALPGMTILFDHLEQGELRAERIDAITDHGGWLPPAFVIDAESGYYVAPEEIVAVLLPGANVQAALLECEASFYAPQGDYCGYCHNYGHRADDCPNAPVEVGP
jgi:hypothetical protein